MNIELLNRIEKVLGEAWSEAARKASANSRKKRGTVGTVVHTVQKKVKKANKEVAAVVGDVQHKRNSFIHKIKSYLHK